MKRGWPGTVRIGLWIIGAVVLPIAVLLVWKPEVPILLTAILLSPLFHNTRPPPIAADQFADATFQNQTETSRKLNALFQQKFQPGTSEADLKAILSAQGFKPLPTPRPDCVPPGTSAPVGRTVITCPAGDLSRELQYDWGDGICRQTISVSWAADGGQTVGGVKVGYRMGCL